MADVSSDRNTAGKPDEAFCKSMNVCFDTDDTWVRIGSNKCHAKAHLVVLLGIVLGKIEWHGGSGHDLAAL